MHGVVPEETLYQNKGKLLAAFYDKVEKWIGVKASIIICVTNVMVDHYKSKFKNFEGRFLVYIISF
jgi:hypothetical protein